MKADKSLLHTTQLAADRLSVVFDWFLAYKLCLNVKKTHCMLFELHRHVYFDNIIVNQCIINRVFNTKFLSIYIEEELTWANHIDNQHSMLRKTTGMLPAMCCQIMCCIIYIMPTLLVDCVIALPFGVILMKHILILLKFCKIVVLDFSVM